MNEYKFEDLLVGHEESFAVTITDEMMREFKHISGDINPLHNDSEYAKESGHPDCVVYGMLTASFMSTLAGVYLPGKYSLIHTVESEFVKPVYVGDLLNIKGTVTQKDDNFKVIWLKVVMTNQSGKKVCRGKMRIGFLH